MIGTFCKSFKHLTKIVEDNKKAKIIVLRNNVYPNIGEVIYNNKTHNIQIYSYLASNVKSLDCLVTDEDKNLYKKYGHVIVCDNTKNFRIWWLSSFNNSPIIILPNDFDEMYNNFIQNNKKAYNQLVSKYSLHDINSMYAFCLSGDSINFYSWIIKNVYTSKISWALIKIIMSWNDKYSFLTNKLSKGTITAYSGFPQIQMLLKEMSNVRKVKRANDSVMQFNTQQKKMLKEKLSDESIQNILSKFGQLTDTKRLNFIRKMSTIDDTNELLKHMSHLCEVHFSWNKDSFLDYLKNTDTIKYDLILDRDNFVLIKVFDYETIKRVAKTTNWCISKNKRYWNDYVEHRSNSEQYVLFDFNKKEDDDMSIIGFTVKKNQGITNAHSFTNNNIMGDSENQNNLNSFLPISNNTIYSILKAHNISLDLFSTGNNLRFDWNVKSFFQFLENIVSEDHIILLKNEDNKVVFISNTYEIQNLFNGSSLNHFETSLFDYDVIFFLDFNKQVNDPTKLIFGGISENDMGEECVSDIFNSNLRKNRLNFDNILEDFGLPYNTIKRVDNPIKRLTNAFRHFDVESIDKILSSNPNLIKNIKSKNDLINISYVINDSIFTCLSIDLIECLYKHNIRLFDIIPSNNVNDTVYSLVSQTYNYFHCLNHIPNESDFKHLFNKEIANREQCMFIGYFYILNQILEKEPYKAFEKTIRVGNHYDGNKVFFETIFEKIISKAITENVHARQSMMTLMQSANKIHSSKITELIQSVKSETPSSDTMEKGKKWTTQPLSYDWADALFQQVNTGNPF